MAVIQKIRDKYAKLAGFVIGLSLVAFIISEGINGTFGNIFGKDTSVASVDGDKIESKDYYEKLAEYEDLSTLYRKGQQMSDDEKASTRQNILDQLIMEKAILKEANKLGLTVSEQEKKEMFYGPNFDGTVTQFPYFVNQETGQFDPAAVKNFEREVSKSNEEMAVVAKKQWDALKSFVVRQRLMNKYNTLIGSAAYTPKFVLESQQKDFGALANARIVRIPFSTINDATIKVTDDELKQYMSKHKQMFENNIETRSFDYVVFNIAPDAQDTAKALGSLLKLKDEFAAATDNEKIVNRNSDESFTNAYVTKEEFKSQYADSIFAMPVGAVYGPYFENESYNLAKITARTTLPDSVKCRHILIKTAEKGAKTLDSAIAKAKIDSISNAIAAGANFTDMVKNFSTDEGSKEKGGEYEFTLAQRPQISTEFGDFIFDGKTGEKKVVYVSNGSYSGFHLIEILEQKDLVSALKIAKITKELITSGRATSAVNALAVKFAGMNSNAKAFDEAAKKDNLNLRVAEDLKPGDFVVQGLGSARELIKWAYSAKIGDVSEPIQLNKKFVVAKLNAIQEPGLKTLTTNLRNQIEMIVRNEKKAKEIAAKYKSMASVDAIAQAAGQQVLNADSIKGNSSQEGVIGFEPKVLGYIFYPKFQPNTLSPAIVGREGVYFVTVTSRQNNQVAPTDLMGLDQQVKMEDMQAKNYVGGMINEVLKRNSTIKYNTSNLQ